MRNQSNTASERAAAAPRRDEAKRGALGRLFERLHTALLRDGALPPLGARAADRCGAGSAATGPAQAAEPGAAPGAAEPAAEARGAAAEPDGVASSSGEPAGEAVGRTDHGEQPGAGPAAAEGAECSGRDGGGGGGGGGGDKAAPWCGRCCTWRSTTTGWGAQVRRLSPHPAGLPLIRTQVLPVRCPPSSNPGPPAYHQGSMMSVRDEHQPCYELSFQCAARLPPDRRLRLPVAGTGTPVSPCSSAHFYAGMPATPGVCC